MTRALFTKVFSLAFLAAVPATVKAGPSQAGSSFDFEFNSIDGQPMPLSAFKGKTLLMVDTASFGKFSLQYKSLQALQYAYEAKGFAVIGVPSNDFGGQEPGKSGDIKKFCETNFGITFPMTDKYAVEGDAAHPLYKWAAGTLGHDAAPGWNFHKYLIGRDGRMVQSFFSGAAPDSKEIVAQSKQNSRSPLQQRILDDTRAIGLPLFGPCATVPPACEYSNRDAMDQSQVCTVEINSVGAAVDLLDRFFRDEGFQTPRDDIARNFSQMLDDSSCWPGIATVDGVPVGIVTVTTMLYVEWGRMGEIGDLYVLPPYRGRGIARALVNAANSWCRSKGCSAASIVITPDGEARHNLAMFYSRLGFEPTGRTFMTMRL